jgi:UDP-N-acetylmuramate dehydrogenase
MQLRGGLFQNFCLKELTSLGVGGTCDFFFVPFDTQDLISFLNQRQKNLPIVCLGGLSNVVISDHHINGYVIYMAKSFQNMNFINGNLVEVGAGVSINNFIYRCRENNTSCIEEMFCIPGTIGGAVCMNAGVPSFEISNVLAAINGVNLDGDFISLRKEEVVFEYRNGNIPNNIFITSCLLRTTELSSSDSLAKLIVDIKRKRMSTQPLGAKTCGSIFKNSQHLCAWKLIDSAGCRGMRIGGAVVSTKHCNFIENIGNASFDDVINLISIIKAKVWETHGIMLEEEVKIIK